MQNRRNGNEKKKEMAFFFGMIGALKTTLFVLFDENRFFIAFWFLESN